MIYLVWIWRAYSILWLLLVSSVVWDSRPNSGVPADDAGMESGLVILWGIPVAIGLFAWLISALMA